LLPAVVKSSGSVIGGFHKFTSPELVPRAYIHGCWQHKSPRDGTALHQVSDRLHQPIAVADDNWQGLNSGAQSYACLPRQWF